MTTLLDRIRTIIEEHDAEAQADPDNLDPENTVALIREALEGECDDCFGNFIPGVRYPTAANEDDSREWIERCDVCERYPSDEAAAQALKRARIIFDYELARPEGSSTLTPFATPESEPES